MKKNIFSIFSLLGFMILFFWCGIKTVCKCFKEKNIVLWFKLWGKVILWWVGIIMVPACIEMIFLEKITAFNHMIGTIYNFLIVIYIYVAGVVITGKLYDWKVCNIDV